jgi:hypothetical protein
MYISYFKYLGTHIQEYLQNKVIVRDENTAITHEALALEHPKYLLFLLAYHHDLTYHYSKNTRFHFN